MHKNNTDDFCSSMVAGLSKAVILEMDGFTKSSHGNQGVQFFRVLEPSNTKSFDFASDNLAGPSIRTMKRRNTVGHDRSFVDYNLKFIKKIKY